MRTTTRMCIGHTNICRPDIVTQVALDNATIAAGSALNNIRNESAYEIFQTNAPTANPMIRLDLGSQRTFDCLGFSFHNLITGFPDGINIEGSNSSFTGAWLNIDFYDWSGDDHDILLRFDSAATYRYLRLTFYRASAWPAFFIGFLFLGTVYEVPQNCRNYHMTSEGHTAMRRAAGGAQYILRGPASKRHQVEIEFQRGNAALAEVIQQKVLDKIAATIQPGGAASVLPNGLPHFFGLFRPAAYGDLSFNPGDHRWETTIVGESLT